jgi:hypothetical protein
VDETYIQTRPKTGYLYRAVDKEGKTVDSLFQHRPWNRRSNGILPQGGRVLRTAMAAEDHPGWP